MSDGNYENYVVEFTIKSRYFLQFQRQIIHSNQLIEVSASTTQLVYYA